MEPESMASKVSDENKGLALSVMLAVSDVPTAVEWYRRALGAVEFWNMGGVAALQIAGAPFLLGEPAGNGWDTPLKLGMPSARVEVFCDSPDAFIALALRAGAKGSLDDIKDHKRPWGIHRQGGFTDPFGHIWLVGDKSPLDFPSVSA
jgi:PhnB protein